jgi:RNA polymerase sigma factor (sigma-70 family)
MNIEQLGSVVRRAVGPIARSGYGLDRGDLAQNAMIAILQAGDRLHCEALVFRRAHWEASNQRRTRVREHRRSEPLSPLVAGHIRSDDAGAEAQLLRREIAALLESVLAELPDRDRNILKWIFWEDLPKAEVAKRLNLSQPRVTQLHKAAQCKLRSALADRGITSTHQCLS